MSNLKTRLLYAVYIFTVIFFFLFYLFPADTVRSYVLAAINQTCPGFNLQTEKISPTLFGGVKLKTVKLYHHQNLLLNADQIKIVPRLWSLFQPPLKFGFKGRAYGGAVKGIGKFAAKPSGSEVAGSAQLAGIQLQDMSALRDLCGRKITGVLDGNLTYDISSVSGGNIDAELILSDCEIELLLPLVNMDNVAFKKIESMVSLSNRTLQLKQCILKGEQMDGTISGSITLNHPLKESVIELSGSFVPQTILLARLSKLFPVNQNRKKTGSFPITLGGTFDKPNFFLK